MSEAHGSGFTVAPVPRATDRVGRHRAGRAERRRPQVDHTRAPYLEALRAYADRDPAATTCPATRAGAGTDPELREALGTEALAARHPAHHPRDRRRGSATPLESALELAADAWGAKRTWFLSNGATQGNHAICLALAGMGDEVSSSATCTPARSTG